MTLEICLLCLLECGETQIFPWEQALTSGSRLRGTSHAALRAYCSLISPTLGCCFFLAPFLVQPCPRPGLSKLRGSIHSQLQASSLRLAFSSFVHMLPFLRSHVLGQKIWPCLESVDCCQIYIRLTYVYVCSRNCPGARGLPDSRYLGDGRAGLFSLVWCDK